MGCDKRLLYDETEPVRERPTDKAYVRKPGAGRPPKPARLVFEAIVYVLRTGCQWKALPQERFGSASAVRKRFLEWERAGAFEAIWKAGLTEYDQVQGIAWRWQSIDAAMFKAPLAQEALGRNPTDRGKKEVAGEATDQARYRANSAGRNRIIVADDLTDISERCHRCRTNKRLSEGLGWTQMKPVFNDLSTVATARPPTRPIRIVLTPGQHDQFKAARSDEVPVSKFFRVPVHRTETKPG